MIPTELSFLSLFVTDDELDMTSKRRHFEVALSAQTLVATRSLWRGFDTSSGLGADFAGILSCDLFIYT